MLQPCALGLLLWLSLSLSHLLASEKMSVFVVAVAVVAVVDVVVAAVVDVVVAAVVDAVVDVALWKAVLPNASINSCVPCNPVAKIGVGCKTRHTTLLPTHPSMHH